MAEIKTLIDNKKVIYTGLFKVEELYAIIKRFCKERGYFPIEERNDETIIEQGKQILLTIKPVKTLSDYAKSKMLIDIDIRGLKDKTITIDGLKQKYQHGTATIIFSAYLETDYRNRFENTGLQFLFRTISNKFIRKDIIGQAEENTKKDCIDLQEEVKTFLNLTRFKQERK